MSLSTIATISADRAARFVLFYITAGRPRHRYQAALLRAAGGAAGEPAAAPEDVMVVITTTVGRVVIQRRACLDDRSADVTRADAAGGLWDNSAIISFR